MTGLRRAALLAVLVGQVGAWLAGVLPLALLPIAALTTVGCSLLSTRAPERVVRQLASVLALLLALSVLPQVLAGGGPEGLRGVLGPLLVGVCAVQALTWQRRRDLQTAVVGALGLLVLSASFAPDVLVGLPLLVGWGAALVAGVLASRERTAESVDLVIGSAPAARAWQPAALAAVLGLVLFLLLPQPDDTGLSSRLASGPGASALGSGRGAPGAYTGDRVDLRVRGDLSDRPVIEVPASSPALWRSGVYTDWDGASWTKDGARRRIVDGVVEPYDGQVRTDTVRVERRAGGVVFAPGPIVSVDLAGRSLVDEHGAVLGATWPDYAVTTAAMPSDPGVLRVTTGEDVVDPRWTVMPPSVPERVRALGRELTAGRSRIDAVLRVQTWLGQHATYQLDSPVPGPGEDAVDRFLFVDRIGFCEQFAAAEVLLLRSAGIPARFVTGLAYGTPSRADRRTYRDRDLHAWVEVFHPGVGWVASDPTPPSTQLAGASLRVKLAAEVTVLLRKAEQVPGGRPALASGLVLLACAVAFRALRPRRARRDAATVAVDASGRPALQAFLRFDQRLGDGRRRDGETLGELSARLGLPDDLRAAVDVVQRECYAPQAPDPGRAVTLLDRAETP